MESDKPMPKCACGQSQGRFFGLWPKGQGHVEKWLCGACGKVVEGEASAA